MNKSCGSSFILHPSSFQEVAPMTDVPEGVTATPHLPAAAPPPPLPDAATDEPYRPVSLWAIIGFALAAVYAFLVLLGGLAPLAGRFPRLIVLLGVLSVLGGALVGLLGRQRGAGRVLAAAGLALAGTAGVLGL